MLPASTPNEAAFVSHPVALLTHVRAVVAGSLFDKIGGVKVPTG